MVHGDLKGVCYHSRGQIHPTVLITSTPLKANILVDETGHARTTDFGLLKITSGPAGLLTSSSTGQSGTVIYETIVEWLPFHKDVGYTISLKIVKGERPFRRSKFTDRLWGMLELFRESQPYSCPNIEEVLHRLEMAL